MLNGHQIVAVYTPPDKPAGRGLEPAPSPIKKAGQSWNLPVIQVSSLKKPEAVGQLAELKPEAIVVAAFGQILPPEVLAIPCYGCLNIHPSLLPKYRGPSPVPAAFLAGDAFAGVSIMLLDAGMDSGPIFARAQLPILPFDDAQSLLSKLFQVGGRMLTQVLSLLPEGRLLPEPQNGAEASYTSEVSKEVGKVDWSQPAASIWHKVRAYSPWPGAYTYWQGKKLKLIEVVALPGANGPQPGLVVSLPPPTPGVGVVTGNGVLGVRRLQIEGKRVMSVEEFLRGQRNFIGSVLYEL
jgi:methionyl-tRNA formyltransferase